MLHNNEIFQLFDLSDRSGKISKFLKIGSSTSLPIIKTLSHPHNPDLVFAASVDGNIYTCSIKKAVPNIFSYG